MVISLGSQLRRRIARSTASAALMLALVVFPGIVSALGPPTNSLRLLTLYHVDWVDPATGTFGFNVTFFRPSADPVQPGWSTALAFSGKNLVIDTFSSPRDFDVQTDGKGVLTIKCLNEAPAMTTASLAAFDKQKAFRRMAVFVNARVLAPAAVADLLPQTITLTDPAKLPAVPLVNQQDFDITPVTQDLPKAPFGPFVGATTMEKVLAADAIPSPNGTDLLATDGLYATAVVYAIATVAFAYGVYDKWNSVQDFRSNGGKPL